MAGPSGALASEGGGTGDDVGRLYTGLLWPGLRARSYDRKAAKRSDPGPQQPMQAGRRGAGGPGRSGVCAPGGPAGCGGMASAGSLPRGQAVGRVPLQASFAAGARWPGSWAYDGAAQQARPRRRTARAVGDPTFSRFGLPLFPGGVPGPPLHGPILCWPIAYNTPLYAANSLAV